MTFEAADDTEDKELLSGFPLESGTDSGTGSSPDCSTPSLSGTYSQLHYL